MKKLGSNSGESEGQSIDNDEEISPKFSTSSFQAREEEIERKKMEIREKVEMQLGRAEEESRRLGHVWEELEVLVDPMRKEVGIIRRRIDVVNRDIKSLGQSCQKKEKEYREALEAFNEKSNEKAQLTSTLMELVDESEKLRMKKLEEISKLVNENENLRMKKLEELTKVVDPTV